MAWGPFNAGASQGGGSSSLQLNRIYVDTQPTKTSYYIGEVFDPTGMVVKADYDNGTTVLITGAVISGYSYDTSPLASGTTKVKIEYTEGGITKETEVAITVSVRKLTIPSQSNSLVYNGDSKSPTWSGFNSTYMTKSGSESEKAAGSYPVVFALRDKTATQWSDGTTADKTVNWVIAKGTPVLTKPTAVTGLKYDGSEKTLINAGSTTGGTLQYKLGTGSWGTTLPKATTAGSYTVYYRVVGGDNYENIAQASLSVSIAQATGTSSINVTSKELTPTASTVDITLSGNFDGTVSVTSSDTNIATVTAQGNNVYRVTGKANGNATITFKVGAGTNYTAPSDKTCAITCKFVSTKLAENSWADIKAVSDEDKGGTYWNVGDRKPVTVNGTIEGKSINRTVYATILGFNHNSSREGTHRIHFMLGQDAADGDNLIAFCDDNYNKNYNNGGRFVMNTTNTNSGGWNGSRMRKTILGNDNTPSSPGSGNFLAALPSDLRAVMKSVTKYSDNTGGGSDTASYVTATTDYLFLLAEKEIWNSASYANSAEQNYQAQYAYFAASNSKVFHNHGNTGTAVYVWCRSVSRYHTGTFVSVNTGGNVSYDNAHYARGVAACFCV